LHFHKARLKADFDTVDVCQSCQSKPRGSITARPASTKHLMLEERSVNRVRFDDAFVDSRAQAPTALFGQAPRKSFDGPARAFSYPAPQRGGRTDVSLPSRASTFSIQEPFGRKSIEAPPLRAISFPIPTSNQYHLEAPESPPRRPSSALLSTSPVPLSPEFPLVRRASSRLLSASPIPVSPEFPLRRSSSHILSASPVPMSPESPPRRTSSILLSASPAPMPPEFPLMRATSFSMSNQSWYESHDSLNSRSRVSPIPMPDQWRRSLKQPRSSLSSPTLSESSTIAYPLSPGTSFHDILDLDLLPKLEPYLNDVPIVQLTQATATWSYSQTLEQLLYPDEFLSKGDTVITRSYLSPSVRSHIRLIADTVSEDSGQGQATTLTIFLARFIMQHGTHVLLSAPGQEEDPTGLKELECRDAMAREISAMLETSE
jgi:hypothetical protein